MAGNGPKKTLIIGAGGFTGRYVCDALAQSGNWTPMNASAAGVDILDLKSFKRVFEAEKPAAIINLAAVSTLSLEDIPLIYRMNTGSIVDMLDYLAKAGFEGRFINASSGLVYGSNTPAPITEESLLDPEHHYSIAKAAADGACRLYGDRLDIVVARPFNCIGLGHKASFVVPKIIDHFRRLAPSITLGKTSVRRDFVDIRDVARMYQAVLDAATPPRIINFCSGRATSIEEIVTTLTSVTGHKIEIRFDERLVRVVENPFMCGDNNRLLSLPFTYRYELADTLSWMLADGPVTS